MIKVPVLIPYRKTEGEELRYALRSLKNITNWNGKVILIGDKPTWIKNVEYIPTPSYPFVFFDVENKINVALDYIKDGFILMNDDIYVTEKTEVKSYYQGIIKDDLSTYHKKCKTRTKNYLISNKYDYLDFEVHTPMFMEKGKRQIVHDLVKDELKSKALQPRSVYGNMFSEDMEFYEDKKTYDDKLPEGKFISTLKYSDEIGKQLEELFPEKSKFE